MAPAFAAIECLAALVAARRGPDTLGSARTQRGTVGGFYTYVTLAQENARERMTHILHRQIGHEYPVAVGGQGHRIRDAGGKAYHRRVGRRRRVLPRPRPSGRASPRCMRRLDKLAYAHTELLHHRASPRTWPTSWSRMRRQGIARLFRQRRLGGDRGGAEDGAAIFRREGRAAARATSSRAARAITATRSARSRPAATNGAARSSSRC